MSDARRRVPRKPSRVVTFTPKTLLIAVLGAGVVVVAYVIAAPGACSGILEQTAPNMRLSVDFVKASGEWVVGRGKIQYLSENERQLGQVLTACCLSRHDNGISA